MKAFPIFSAFLIFAIILYSSFMRFCLLPESNPADGEVISSLLQEYDTGWVIEKEEIIGAYPKSDERKAYWIKDKQVEGD